MRSPKKIKMRPRQTQARPLVRHVKARGDQVVNTGSLHSKTYVRFVLSEGQASHRKEATRSLTSVCGDRMQEEHAPMRSFAFSACLGVLPLALYGLLEKGHALGCNRIGWCLPRKSPFSGCARVCTTIPLAVSLYQLPALRLLKGGTRAHQKPHARAPCSLAHRLALSPLRKHSSTWPRRRARPTPRPRRECRQPCRPRTCHR